MTAARARVVVLSAVMFALGCGAPSPPNRAAVACLEAMQQVATTPRLIAVPQLACADLYQDRGCREAWAALATADVDPADAAAAIERACGAACVRRSPPGAVPAACVGSDPGQPPEDRMVAIDRELLRLQGLSPDLAWRLSQRARLFSVTVTRVDRPAPPAVETPPPIVVRVDGDQVRLGDRTLPLTDLPAAVHGATRVMIVTAPEVPHARVVAVMEAIKAGGVTDVILATDQP